MEKTGLRPQTIEDSDYPLAFDLIPLTIAAMKKTAAACAERLDE